MKPKSKQINLVLSGTGAMYPVHAGAVCALMDLGYTFKALSGTSGGAIIATAIAGGVSRDRLKRSVIDYNPWRILFKNPQFPFGKGWGVYNNKPIETILDRFGGDITFEQSPIPINIIATQLIPTYSKFLFNKMNTPDVSLSEACRISSTIPILFQAIKYKGSTFIDGTFADNLHIDPYRNEFENTIAICVKVRSMANPNTFWQYLKSCLSMIITGQGAYNYIPDNLTFIPIDIHNYTVPLKFNLSRKDRHKLFEAGYNAVMFDLTNKE